VTASLNTHQMCNTENLKPIDSIIDIVNKTPIASSG